VTDAPTPTFVDRGWSFIQVWGVPIGMTGAYAMMMWSSDTDTSGKAWMSIGLSFVFVIWFVFRLLTQDAALSRAMDVGDSPRILELCARYLASHKAAAARAPYLVARAYAHELAANWPAALSSLDEARLSALSASKRPRWAMRAASTRIAALVGTGKLDEARAVLERELAPDAGHPMHSEAYLIANLAAGRVLAAEGKPAEAAARLRKVTDDIKASAAMRKVVEATLVG